MTRPLTPKGETLDQIFLGTLGVVAIASAAFFAMVLRQPDDFSIERTASINAGADDAYAQVINLRRSHHRTQDH